MRGWLREIKRYLISAPLFIALLVLATIWGIQSLLSVPMNFFVAITTISGISLFLSSLSRDIRFSKEKVKELCTSYLYGIIMYMVTRYIYSLDSLLVYFRYDGDLTILFLVSLSVSGWMLSKGLFLTVRYMYCYVASIWWWLCK